MSKNDVVRLTDEERAIGEATVATETGRSRKLRRATILLQADGPAWTDATIREAVGGRTRTVEDVRHAFVRERFVTDGFDLALDGRPRAPGRRC